MPAKKSSTSGMGFNPAVRKADSEKGYVTLFEKIVERTDGKKRSFTWYQNTLKTLANQYKLEPDKLKKDEKRDSLDKEDYQDENIQRRRVVDGRLYFFRYEAKMKNLPYYDEFPLVYVIKNFGSYFYGANLHYMSPKSRVKVINELKRDKINIPRSIIHKYIDNNVEGLFLELAEIEWETSILIPVEHFVTRSGLKKKEYKKELVWEETNESKSDKLVGKRILKFY